MLAQSKNFKDIKKNLNKIPVIFLGSVEQHGPFMPIGTDTVIAQALSAALEKELGNKILIFPLIPFGVASEHLGFPGTIAIKSSTYSLLLNDILDSLSLSGFKHILIISTHGGNDLTIKTLITEFNMKNSTKVNYIFAFDKQVDAKAKQLFGTVDKHAGSSENSLIAYLEPKLVKFIGKKTNKLFNPTKTGIFSKYKTIEATKIGILNNSSLLEVSPQKGEQLFNFMVSRITAIINNL